MKQATVETVRPHSPGIVQLRQDSITGLSGGQLPQTRASGFPDTGVKQYRSLGAVMWSVVVAVALGCFAFEGPECAQGLLQNQTKAASGIKWCYHSIDCPPNNPPRQFLKQTTTEVNDYSYASSGWNEADYYHSTNVATWDRKTCTLTTTYSGSAEINYFSYGSYGPATQSSDGTWGTNQWWVQGVADLFTDVYPTGTVTNECSYDYSTYTRHVEIDDLDSEETVDWLTTIQLEDVTRMRCCCRT